MKKHLFIFMLILLLFFPSCEKKAPSAEAFDEIQTENSDFYPEGFLFFDGRAVSYDVFRYYFLNYKKMYLENDSSFFDNEENKEKLKSDVVSILLDKEAIQLFAEENGVVFTETDRKTVAEEMKKSKKFYEENEGFSETLSASFLTEELYKKTLEESLLSRKLFNLLYEDGGKEAWDTNTYYAYFKENYLSAERILLPYAESETKENAPKTLKKAEEILERLKNGEDFYLLIKAYENNLVFQEGDSLDKKQTEPELFSAAASLKTGEISSPIFTEKGVLLIRRIEDSPFLMEKKRQEALFGFTDEDGVFHPGAYDEDFVLLYQKRAEKIKVTYGTDWEKISTDTVH